MQSITGNGMCPTMHLRDICSKLQFRLSTSAPEEYWVYGILQAMLMKVIKEHLNLAHERPQVNADCDDNIK